jgi:peptide/nickel transport system substrate-binding protein
MFALRLLRLSFAAAAIACTAAACSGAASQPASTPRAVLRIADRNPFAGFRPPKNGGELDRLLHTCLFEVGHDNELVPSLAVAIPTRANGMISKDGLRIDYHLRRDARWEDGTRIDAGDVIFTWHAILNPDNTYPMRFPYDHVRSITELDPYTIRVTLAQRNASFVPKFFAENWCFDVLPRHRYERYKNLDAIPHDMDALGSGPYILASWQRDSRAVLKANPRYFAGAPHIAEIDDVFMGDTNTVIAQMKTGELDADVDASPSEAVALAHDPKLRIVVTPQPVVGTLFFNCTDPVLRDRRIRQAINYAIDRPALAREVSYGYFDPQTPERAPFDFAYDPRVPTYSLDLRRAGALLDAAGWTRGASGTRTRNGVPLEIVMVSSENGIDPRVDVLVQSQLARAGIAVIIKAYDIHQLFAPADQGGPIYGRTFQIWYQTYNFQGDDGDLAGEMACDQQAPGGLNVFDLCDPRFDAVNRAALLTFDDAKRRAYYSRAQQYLHEDAPWVLLYREPKIDIISRRLEHFVGVPGPPSFFHANAWQLTP